MKQERKSIEYRGGGGGGDRKPRQQESDRDQ